MSSAVGTGRLFLTRNGLPEASGPQGLTGLTGASLGIPAGAQELLEPRSCWSPRGAQQIFHPPLGLAVLGRADGDPLQACCLQSSPGVPGFSPGVPGFHPVFLGSPGAQARQSCCTFQDRALGNAALGASGLRCPSQRAVLEGDLTSKEPGTIGIK